MNKYSKLINDIRYSFKDFKLLETSLTHSSFDKNKRNYEKLEFLGDRILGLIISINPVSYTHLTLPTILRV